ncbi:transposase family protein [Saccharopolyspora sp. NPDC003752]
MGLRWFRDRIAIPTSARDNDISRATGYRYIDEVIEVLDDQAPDLHQALRKARNDGAMFVILDGKLFSCDRLGEKTTSVTGTEIHRWYSGKHRDQGGNIQALTTPEDSRSGSHRWNPARSTTSPPPNTTSSARCTGPPPQLDLPTLADGGYQGAGIHTVIKHSKTGRGRPLDPDNRTYNQLLRSLHALGERGFASLIGRWRTLQHITASPRKPGHIVQAALVLTHHEHGYT